MKFNVPTADADTEIFERILISRKSLIAVATESFVAASHALNRRR